MLSVPILLLPESWLKGES